MDQQLAPAELLRFLQAEAETLQQIQVKISNELHHLQVEEEVFVRTVERLNENAGRNQSTATATTKGTTGAGMELVVALHQELASALPLVSTLPPDSAPSTTPSVHLIFNPPPCLALPPGLALPTAITETETEELKMEPQSAAPSGVGFDDDEYELLERLESDDE